jgi:hypothetical protein
MHGLPRSVNRRMKFLPLLTFVIAAAVRADEPPTYAEALAEAKRHADEPAVRSWIEQVGKPFWNENLQSVFGPCLADIPPNTSITVRLLVEVGEGGRALRYIDDSPTPFSTCVKEQLQSIEWPKAPIELRYFPIELHVSTRKEPPPEEPEDE